MGMVDGGCIPKLYQPAIYAMSYTIAIPRQPDSPRQAARISQPSYWATRRPSRG